MAIDVELEAAADAWQALCEQVGDSAPPAKAISAEARRQELKEALNKVDVVRLAELTKKLSTLVETMLATNLDETTECDEATLEAIMTEQLEMQELKDLLDMRYELRRARIFAHITNTHIQNAIADPSHAAGEAPVPRMGRRFTREGGKVKFNLDNEKLKALLGPERSAQVFQTVVKTEETRSDGALTALMTADPAVMEMVRSCVVAISHTPSSFHVRKM